MNLKLLRRKYSIWANDDNILAQQSVTHHNIETREITRLKRLS